MIACSRRVVRSFRTACGKCVIGRPRGPGPAVILRQSKGQVTLTAPFPAVTVEMRVSSDARGRDEVLVVPMKTLEAVEGATDEPVTFESTGGLNGTARWNDRGQPRGLPVCFVLPGKPHESPAWPLEWGSVPARLLTALHEAGRFTSREDGRYAFSRVQLQGRAGRVVATDGKAAVLFEGFRFPVTEDLLLPAIPLFGWSEWRDAKEVRMGRTPTHLVLSVEKWTVWLAVTAGKFPVVAGVVPRNAPTTVNLDPGDTATLLTALPGLPGQAHDHRPVTVEADRMVVVRGWEEATREIREERLVRSHIVGPPTRVTLDRRVLARALGLGCQTLRVTPQKPLVIVGENVTVLAAPLDPQLEAPPSSAIRSGDKRLSPTSVSSSNSRSPANPHSATATSPERRDLMKSPAPHGHSQRPDQPDSSAGTDLPDPLTAAEELRTTLAEVMTKTTRLIATLKAGRKEKKALSAVWAGLKQLHFGAGGQRT